MLRNDRLLKVGLFLLAFLGLGLTGNNAISPQAPTNGKATFIQGTDAAGTYKTVYTAAAGGSQCTGLEVATNDGTASHVITFEIVNSAVNYHLSTVTPALAPTNNTTFSTTDAFAAVNWAGLPVDSDSNHILRMVTGDVLKATFATALTSTDEINVLATCADFS